MWLQQVRRIRVPESWRYLFIEISVVLPETNRAIRQAFRKLNRITQFGWQGLPIHV